MKKILRYYSHPRGQYPPPVYPEHDILPREYGFLDPGVSLTGAWRVVSVPDNYTSENLFPPPHPLHPEKPVK